MKRIAILLSVVLLWGANAFAVDCKQAALISLGERFNVFGDALIMKYDAARAIFTDGEILVHGLTVQGLTPGSPQYDAAKAKVTACWTEEVEVAAVLAYWAHDIVKQEAPPINGLRPVSVSSMTIVDRDQLRSAFLNTLFNATEAVPTGAEIITPSHARRRARQASTSSDYKNFISLAVPAQQASNWAHDIVKQEAAAEIITPSHPRRRAKQASKAQRKESTGWWASLKRELRGITFDAAKFHQYMEKADRRREEARYHRQREMQRARILEELQRINNELRRR